MSLETKQFGNTGHGSTRVVFGGASLVGVSQEEADSSLEVLLEFGVNHIDVAASYGEGEAEKRMAPWMAKHRQRFFLATKTGQRGYREARDEFHASLERLRVDSVDLIQLHNLIDPTEWELALGPHGALEALIEAREQGLTRFIGVTGHGYSAPLMHTKSLERFDFDSVLLPYNFLMTRNEEYARFFGKLRERCAEKNVALQTIKSIARRPWQGESNHSTWYQPLEDQEAIHTAVSWVLGDPEVFLVTAGDIHLLPRILEAASQPNTRPTDVEMERLLKSREMRTIFQGTEFIG
jgi:aryl-alcohol dehydrogenase-like predicted oxidoreductase